jgi:hypothetical protein
MALLKIVKPSTSAEKVTRTTVDTIEITPDLVSSWIIPPFQRPLRVNQKVIALAEMIKQDGGVIPGMLTVGVLGAKRYLLDGQHRREAFLISKCATGYVDIRVHHFESMPEMGEEFVNLNSQLVRMRPDDILRGLEGTIESLSKIRKHCSFVGYDMIRRSDRAPIVSMSALLRCWLASHTEVPRNAGIPAQQLAMTLTEDESDNIVQFLDLAFQAWGRDEQYARLWGSLNLIICMWMYRRMVVTQYSPKTPRLTKDMFRKCLMSVSSTGDYLDWLVGRKMSERDRSPCYARLKAIFAKRIEVELGSKVFLPAPAWGGR